MSIRETIPISSRTEIYLVDGIINFLNYRDQKNTLFFIKIIIIRAKPHLISILGSQGFKVTIITFLEPIM